MPFIPTPAREAAQKFIIYLNESPTPYHAVSSLKTRLLEAGFEERSVSEKIGISRNHGYFVTREDTCLVAFLVGGKMKDTGSISIVATHTDSPCLKLKRGSNRGYGNYSEIGVTLYGGGIWYSWFDRELKMAGKVWHKGESNGVVKGSLVHIDKPIAYVPNLAIHFTRTDTFTPDLEKNILPIIALTDDKYDEDDTTNPQNPFVTRLICKHLNIVEADIVEMDISLIDHNPAKMVGYDEEFIVGGRLDNLISTYTAIEALIEAKSSSHLANANRIYMVACFNNEEVGNNTNAGALSDFLSQLIANILDDSVNYDRVLDKSFIISADVVHAVHPNYSSFYEINHAPELDKGMVIKYNAAMNYATNGFSATVVREIGRRANLPPFQSFIIRNDAKSGSTLGPAIAAKLGVECADVGTSLLAMHSVRELAGTQSIAHAIDFFAAFFEFYDEIRNSFN